MKNKLSYPLPWDRILARGIDTLIYLLIQLCCFPIWVIVWGSFLGYMDIYTRKETMDTLLMLTGWHVLRICSFLFCESFFLKLFSTTPGKALLGLYVIERDGNRVSFASALSRTIRVCVYLYFCFMPYLSIFIPLSCMAHLYIYKAKADNFLWDGSERWSVIPKKSVPKIFKIITWALFLILVLLLAYKVITKEGEVYAFFRLLFLF